MELREDHKKDRRKAVIGSVLFHALLVLLFLFYGLKEPHPPREEKMVSIDMNFGTDLQGRGETESQSEEEDPSSESEETQEETETQESATEETVTQEESVVEADDEDAESEEEQQEEEEEQEESEEQNVSEELKSAQDRLEEMKNEGGGEGDDEKEGNEGNPEGKEEGKGDLGGAGGSWKLSGREILQKPQPEKPQEEGKVVIDIWVDQEGNVIRTSPNLSQSNTTSDKLLRLAEEAAKEAKFNPSSQAAVEQKGKFTFLFEMR